MRGRRNENKVECKQVITTADDLSVARRLLTEGRGCTAIAKTLGVSRQTAYRWKQQFEAGGLAAVAAGRSPGPAGQLTSDQLQELMLELQRIPEGVGFGGRRWSLKTVARFIQSRFDVEYGISNVSRLMLALGVSIKALK